MKNKELLTKCGQEQALSMLKSAMSPKLEIMRNQLFVLQAMAIEILGSLGANYVVQDGADTNDVADDFATQIVASIDENLAQIKRGEQDFIDVKNSPDGPQ